VVVRLAVAVGIRLLLGELRVCVSHYIFVRIGRGSKVNVKASLLFLAEIIKLELLPLLRLLAAWLLPLRGLLITDVLGPKRLRLYFIFYCLFVALFDFWEVAGFLGLQRA